MPLVDENGLDEQEFLAHYNPQDYERPSVTADTVICSITRSLDEGFHETAHNSLRVLLIKRKGHPCIGQWALPGGFVEPDETVGEAAAREVLEETGVVCTQIQQLYVFSSPARDPRTRIITCAHVAVLNDTLPRLQAGSDAQDARWFSVTAHEAAGGIALTLTCDDICLTASVRYGQGVLEPEIRDNKGLAFDHAAMIACAIQRLRETHGLKLANT